MQLTGAKMGDQQPGSLPGQHEKGLAMFGKTLIPTSALRSALISAVAMLAAITASAQSSTTYTEYAVKFICGVPSAVNIANGVVEKAQYSTSINIHNPNLFTTDRPISFLKKAVIAITEGYPLAAPSSFTQDSLPNDYAEKVSCAVIRNLLGAPAAPAFIEGFVVIIVPPASSPNQLDVTAVYTSSNNPPTSLQVVPIAGRVITPPPVGAALEGKIE
jgi:hypothetical protein